MNPIFIQESAVVSLRTHTHATINKACDLDTCTQAHVYKKAPYQMYPLGAAAMNPIFIQESAVVSLRTHTHPTINEACDLICV